MSLVETQIVDFRKRLWPKAQSQIARCLNLVNGLQGGQKRAVFDLSPSLFHAFDRRVKFVAASLEKRQNMELPESRRDLLLATYVLGLTSPFYEDGPADQHLEAIRRFLAPVMPPERVTQTLLAAPAEGDDWYESALDPIEAIGRKDGHALFIRYIGADGTTSIEN
ncbi:hypothetical protein [Phyllobacterium sp. P30BS-XVII]|uniref:hypothetical protein n=1 Tax=Phyllobacterium sp. P30BS-XVII TaxID=2587046 RepID=UPI000DDA6A20|nr:hypothetical protein [Phyllobacterium sp. P30BS-XVII]MBA8903909.1 hypothetical protein [Phyllobacterium sp. P30BS-XVII]